MENGSINMGASSIIGVLPGFIDRCMPYCPPMSFWGELFSNCTGGLILSHKRTLIAEIRASVAGV
jgi:hypothetical protein